MVTTNFRPGILLLHAVCVLSASTAHGADVYNSPTNDGAVGSAVGLTIGGPARDINLWIDGGSNPSGTSCRADAGGDEVCAYDLRVEASGGVTILSFSPATSVVAHVTGDQLLRANEIDINAQPGPRPVGTLTVIASASGSVQLNGEVFVDAGLNEVPLDTLVTLALTGDDTDGDGVLDQQDNCTLEANADQRDSNGDGYGNRCDADLNNDGITNVVDLGLLRSEFFTANEDADLNGDGVVNVIDLGILRSLFFNPPGPSGVAGGGA